MRYVMGCVIGVLALVSIPVGGAEAPGLKEGDSFGIGGRRYIVRRLDALPYVENDYSKRFKFDSSDNPKLKQLRTQYHLEDVVAPGKDEFDRQLLLLDWVNHRFKKFGKPSCDARGALAILEAIEQGNTFFCSHYADVFVSAAAAMGWVDRPLALRRPDQFGSGSTEHSSTEIWSNQFRKWVMLDPTFAMYVEKASAPGLPLNAWEIRQEWFYRDGKYLVFVLDKDRKHYRKSDMPVFRGRYENFGDLVLDGGALNPYGFIGYIPNTNLLTAGPDYGGMFITRDKLCEGTKWHQRTVPAHPETDPYFPINQSSATLTPTGSKVTVSVKTLTPNFKTFLTRTDNGAWKPSDATITWTPHPGSNRLEVKAVNQFEVEGPASSIEIDGEI
jgi:transglutaminase-like putative cysteine protease